MVPFPPGAACERIDRNQQSAELLGALGNSVLIGPFFEGQELILFGREEAKIEVP